MEKRVFSYISDVWEAFGLAICDFVCITLGLALLVMPWRLISEFKAIKEAQGTTRNSKMITICAETIIDLLYFLPFALILVTIYRIPRLFSGLYQGKCAQ
jgi:hypothetical protein